MSITDELREWSDKNSTFYAYALELDAIADRIDAACKQAIDKAHADGERNGVQQARSASEDYRRGYEKGVADGLDVGFADALADHGWVRLPVDADGEYWHIGDKSEHGTVDYLSLTEDGWVVEGDDGLYEPEALRHVQPDSWERIIEDALGNGDVYTELDVERLVARCRALAGEGE